MPELAIYFTIVLESLAVTVSLIFGITLVIGFYQAMNWIQRCFKLLGSPLFGSRRAQKKAEVIVLPARCAWNSVRSI